MNGEHLAQVDNDMDRLAECVDASEQTPEHDSEQWGAFEGYAVGDCTVIPEKVG